MAHQDTEAAELNDMDQAAAAFGDYYAKQEEPDPAVSDVEEEGSSNPSEDELELDDNEEGESNEQGNAPAIEAPASLNAEEKARFSQLPREAQQLLTEVETRRNGQVQQATTKAAEAQRTAEARAASADAEHKARYAQQLDAIVAELAPVEPDPRLAQVDPAAYIAQKAQFDAAKAQHDGFVQQVRALGEEASAQMDEAFVKARDEELMQVPEIQNPETREIFFKRSIETAQSLGLDMSQINHATAGELKALRQISDWKERAEKYDAAMARQMQRVREGKRAPSAKPGHGGLEQGKGLRDAKQKLKASGDLRDAAAAFARL